MESVILRAAGTPLNSGHRPPLIPAACPPHVTYPTARMDGPSTVAKDFLSGCVRTRGKFEHAFGYYNAPCRMQTQPGFWSAFWMYTGGRPRRRRRSRRHGIDISEKSSATTGPSTTCTGTATERNTARPARR